MYVLPSMYEKPSFAATENKCEASRVRADSPLSVLVRQKYVPHVITADSYEIEHTYHHG